MRSCRAGLRIARRGRDHRVLRPPAHASDARHRAHSPGSSSIRTEAVGRSQAPGSALDRDAASRRPHGRASRAFPCARARGRALCGQSDVLVGARQPLEHGVHDVPQLAEAREEDLAAAEARTAVLTLRLRLLTECRHQIAHCGRARNLPRAVLAADR
eukprot:scaffold41612_cov75-Phaeocystis_antarctica.AAC.5